MPSAASPLGVTASISASRDSPAERKVLLGLAPTYTSPGWSSTEVRLEMLWREMSVTEVSSS